MATCKECTHYDVCGNRKEILSSGICVLDSIDVENVCPYFKDRSRFVELPCKVGDMIYVIEDIAGEWKIIKDHVETIGIGYYADGVNLYQFDGIKTDGYFEDFGKTVFLTREEAEEALKERE